MYHEDIIVNAAEDLSKFAKYPEGQYIELVHNSGKNAILTKGLPIPVEWYDENDGGAMDKQQFIRSQSTKPLTTNAFTNGEMTLIGWNTVPDGSGSACPSTRRRGMPSPA